MSFTITEQQECPICGKFLTIYVYIYTQEYRWPSHNQCLTSDKPLKNFLPNGELDPILIKEVLQNE